MAALPNNTSSTETSISIDGMLTDSVTIASVLDETQQRHKISELTLRNVSIDDLVADATERLLLQRLHDDEEDEEEPGTESSALEDNGQEHDAPVSGSRFANRKLTGENTGHDDQRVSLDCKPAANLGSDDPQAQIPVGRIDEDDENDTRDSESNVAQVPVVQSESVPIPIPVPRLRPSRTSSRTSFSTTTSDEDVDIIHSANLHRLRDSAAATGVVFHRPFTSQYFQRFKAFHGRTPSSFKYFGKKTDDTKIQRRRHCRRIWSKVELIHCSGRVSSVLSTVATIVAVAGAYTGTTSSATVDNHDDPSTGLPPAIQQISFTGSVPIAHNPRYSLDNESMEAIGRALAVVPTPAAISSSLVLSTLSIKGTRLDPVGWRLMCDGIAASVTLLTLRMSHCALQVGNVEQLALAMRHNKHLQVLLLAHCRAMTANPNPLPDQNSTGEHANGIDSSTSAFNDANAEDDIEFPLAGTERSVETARRGIIVPTAGVGGDDDNRDESQNDDPGDPAQPNRFSLDPLLESLVHHPALECLNIDGMQIESPRAIQALADLVASPTSKLWHLGLKNNGRVPDDKPDLMPVISALRNNTVMTSLLLSGNNIDDNDVEALATILTNHNRTLRGLSLTANRIGDDGINALANHLPQIRGLNYLDMQRNTQITAPAKERLISALEHNCEIERLDLDGTYHLMKAYYLNLNRGGRRLLLAHNAAPTSLWPIVLSRVNHMNFGRLTPTARLDVLYCLLRGPALLQQRRRPFSEDDADGEARKKRSRV